MTPLKAIVMALALASAMAPPGLRAADKVSTVPVHFAKGASGATLTGNFSGYDSVEHTLAARAGQTLRVRITGRNANFNVFAPGDRPGKSTAIGNGYAGADWSGTLPANGTYTIQVFQMRASARRGSKVAYTIGFDVTGAPSARARTAPGAGHDASGMVPCAAVRGQPMGQCRFTVSRRPGGLATVVVTHPDGHRRAIFFQGGTATGTDLGASAGKAFTTTRESDLYLVRAGDERYEIPDVVVSGD